MRINNNVNNVNFKAKVEVNIGEDLLAHLSHLPPETCVKFAKETTESITLLKKVAQYIGTDKDVIALKSYKNRELDLNYNGHYEITVCDSDLPGSVIDEMAFCIKHLAQKLNPADKTIPDLNKILKNPLANYIFTPIKGRSDAAKKMPITPNGYKELELPDIIKIEDCLNEVRNLNTVA